MKKYLWMSSAAVVIGALRVKIITDNPITSIPDSVSGIDNKTIISLEWLNWC